MSTAQKHVLNTPQTLVVDSLKGLVALNPNVKLDEAQRVIYKPKTSSSSRVALLSGGGSGHEPAHAGFVGDGLLDAAVCGNIFASPNVAQIRRGIELVTGDKGALVVVMNYTGDALHFGLAAEQFRASGKGDVRVVMVGDDVAVSREQGSIVGRRGLAGTILVYKIASALSTAGGSLDACESLALYINSRLGTIGIGLDHCHVPGTSAHDSHLGSNQFELGMGIHNEAGTSKHELTTVAELVDQMLTKIIDTEDKERAYVPFKLDGGDEVVLLVNDLGAVSQLELGGIVSESQKWLSSKNIKIRRVLSGTYMTSLSMPGFSLTLLLLPRDGEQGEYTSKQIIEYLDAPASAPGWAFNSVTEPGVHEKDEAPAAAAVQNAKEVDLSPTDSSAFLSAIQRACRALIAAEPELTKQDQIAGDGDAGLTLEAGAKGVLKAIEQGKIQGKNVIEDVKVIAEVVEDDMGGTSGALYSIFFAGLGRSLRESANGGASSTTPEVWAKAASDAQETLYKYTRARPPSRTLVDPLDAFTASLPSKGLHAAAEDALAAAEKTKELVAKAGRGAYVNQEELKKREVPDPGAWGVWRILDGLRGFEA